MFFVYNLLYFLAFLLLIPRFLFDFIFGGKYAAGFKERLGFLPDFHPDSRAVIWIHCVSVGETNAARPIVDILKKQFPSHRLIVSTTTKTGQELAKQIFVKPADAVFYFPFDFRFSVRRALAKYKPSVILIMETEIWPNFLREASHANARLAVINGRISERSFKRYSYIKPSIRRVLGYLDLALMQTNADASRIMAMGLRASKVRVTGNLKFDHSVEVSESRLSDELRSRFDITSEAPLILAASTHEPEEEWILAAFREVWKGSGDRLPRLMIAPRHPERFDHVAEIARRSGFALALRSAAQSPDDTTAEILLLDTIGELRSAYPLAEIVFVGGSLIPHGGQSVFEPAAAGKAIITGPHTANFREAVEGFIASDALIQLPKMNETVVVPHLTQAFRDLLEDQFRREELGRNALTFADLGRGAAERSVEYLSPLLPAKHAQ